MDNGPAARQTPPMAGSGPTRDRLAGVLNAAYGDGLLSEHTLVHRLGELFGSDLVDPHRLTGDLTFRGPGRSPAGVLGRARRALTVLLAAPDHARPERLLALDWSGGREEITIGRETDCDIVLRSLSVSRRHLRLRFRDGVWILHDLESTNGTTVNDQRVVRCRLMPGDRLEVGAERLVID